MEALFVLAFVVLLALIASRFGYDSSPRLESHEERLARSGFMVDHETLTVQSSVGRQSTGPAAGEIADLPGVSRVATTG
jgi:hypothetical protein